MIRRLRLASGLVLFVYATSHFANHALGLFSLDAMEAGRIVFLAVWRNPLGTTILYGAFALHILLVLWAIFERRSLRMSRGEAVQLAIGLAIPFLLLEHVIGTRYMDIAFDVEDRYAYVLLVLWSFAPEVGVRQSLLLVAVWAHGCMGVHYWLRLRPWYPRVAPLLYAGAILVPALALLGFADAGQEVVRRFADPDDLAALLADLRFPNDAALAEAGRLLDWSRGGFAALIAAAFLARVGRDLIERRRGVFEIVYPSGKRVRGHPGMTILEVSRDAGIPHASVCGGRGRCSTCRVRIGAGLDELPPPAPEEARVLARINAAPNLRLACQTRPRRNVSVTPLLRPGVGPRAGLARAGYLQGSEREIAILFADMRAFTALSEHKLPYDVVFLLNRYFRALGEAIESAGGHLDKFIGDGVMALFGLSGDPAEGCRRALAAARAMAAALETLNDGLADELDAPLRIGIGIHVGEAIVGEMGYARATTVTAIGDAVNTASRLEGLTRDFDCQLVVSERVAERAGVSLDRFPSERIAVRGRSEPLCVRLVADARALPEAGRSA